MSPHASGPDSFTEKEDIRKGANPIHTDLKALDVGLALVVERADDSPVAPNESRRLRRKVDLHVLPLLFLIYTVQYIDKNTIASASILGFISDNHLSTSEFNSLASAFFVGYLVFQWPQSWALQRFPVGRWLTLNIFLWSVLLGLHALCHGFASLFILRFLLGASEGSMTSGVMLVCSMFYTRGEVNERIGWTFQCNGLAVVISGFLQFGLTRTSPQRHPNQWQWLVIITALITFASSLLFLLFFPDNPLNARFLTSEERILAVNRVRENQNGIETKTWKRSQLIETLRDPKAWLFFFLMASGTLTGGVALQYSLLIQDFGFSELQTTLLGIPTGIMQIVSITSACYAVRRYPNSRAWISICTWIPSIIACIMQICTPLSYRIVHLVGMYIMYLGASPSLIIGMSWVVSNTSGHTKKLTTTAMSMIGFSLGNALGPQFWLEQYKPRNRIPWGLTLMSAFMAISCTFALRTLFARENRRREDMKLEATRCGGDLSPFEEWSTVEAITREGELVQRKVDKMYLDLTDSENLAFRYVL